MKIDECIKKIERYLTSSDYTPRLVNFQNKDDLSAITQRFSVGSNEFVFIATYAANDENPKLDEFQSAIAEKTGNLFISGLTSFLKLMGEATLLKELEKFTTQTYRAHVIVLCYQCEQFIQFTDSRASRIVYYVDGLSTGLPEIIFTLPDSAMTSESIIIDGIQRLPNKLEILMGGKLYVRTKKHKSNYSNSLLFIREENKAFDALKSMDSSTNALDITMGTDEQWIYALKEVRNAGSWGKLIEKQFNISSNLFLIVSNWKTFSSDIKWLYFIALKLNGAGDNWCLNQAIRKSDTAEKLLRQIYRSLLDILHTDMDFWSKYDERKSLINFIGASDEEMIDYLQMLKSKESEGIYYLTDNSRIEKEKIFELLDRYAQLYSKDDVLCILRHVYPDLYDYMKPYRFRNEPKLYSYFQDYKYQKITNKISPEFLAVVEKQAIDRNYNLWLSPRSEKIEALNKNGARLYFVDSLGVEYLSFILARCKGMNMLADVSICRCELPSITKFNKVFLEAFNDVAPDIKRLDDIKHHGEESFDYRQTKLPVHLIRELEIISDVLMDIRNKLANGSIERAFIISDHGASRLSVIHESENQWEMASKGEHSGRCCRITEADVQSEYATEANGFWVLANYDRFKGSRKANVEVHGGATLEEVTVPVIELTYRTGDIEVTINSKLPVKICRYRKKIAELQLFSKTKLGGVTVCINGKKLKNEYYDAEPQSDNLYLVQMPAIEIAGEYSMQVFSNDNPVAQLKFSVKKEGSEERNINI